MSGPTTLSLQLDHAGASVADLGGSMRFYSDVMGFAVEEEFRIPNTPVRGAVMRHPGGARIELFHRDDSQAAAPGHPIDSTLRRGWFQLAFAVADVRAAYAQVVAGGASAVKPPFCAPDGRAWVAFIGDPDGNLIELIQRDAAPGAAHEDAAD